MVISHRYRYLYFVIPKCASTTVRSSLKDYTDIGYPVSKYTHHMPLRQFFASQFSNLAETYFKFTFTRNPYDRLYSGFMQDRLAATQAPRWERVKAPIFREIGDDFNRYIMEYVLSADRLNAWEWICFCPMRDFVYFEGKCKLDWIGRAEKLEAGLKDLSEKLGIDIVKSQNLNVNTEPTDELKYLSKYERATIEAINDIYRDDFELFGYEMLDPSLFPVKIEQTRQRP